MHFVTMKLVVLILELLILIANQYIVSIKSCCDLISYIPLARVPSGVYKMSMGTFGTVNVYCDMTTDDGGWIVIQRNRNSSLVVLIGIGEWI